MSQSGAARKIAYQDLYWQKRSLELLWLANWGIMENIQSALLFTAAQILSGPCLYFEVQYGKLVHPLCGSTTHQSSFV